MPDYVIYPNQGSIRGQRIGALVFATIFAVLVLGVVGYVRDTGDYLGLVALPVLIIAFIGLRISYKEKQKGTKAALSARARAELGSAPALYVGARGIGGGGVYLDWANISKVDIFIHTGHRRYTRDPVEVLSTRISQTAGVLNGYFNVNVTMKKMPSYSRYLPGFHEVIGNDIIFHYGTVVDGKKWSEAGWHIFEHAQRQGVPVRA